MAEQTPQHEIVTVPVPPGALKLGEAAKYLRTGPATVHRLREAGYIKGFRLGRGRGSWRFDKASLDRFIASAPEHVDPDQLVRGGRR